MVYLGDVLHNITFYGVISDSEPAMMTATLEIGEPRPYDDEWYGPMDFGVPPGLPCRPELGPYEYREHFCMKPVDPVEEWERAETAARWHPQVGWFSAHLNRRRAGTAGAGSGEVGRAMNELARMMQYGRCHEEVSRQGELQPCGQDSRRGATRPRRRQSISGVRVSLAATWFRWPISMSGRDEVQPSVQRRER